MVAEVMRAAGLDFSADRPDRGDDRARHLHRCAHRALLCAGPGAGAGHSGDRHRQPFGHRRQRDGCTPPARRLRMRATTKSMPPPSTQNAQAAVRTAHHNADGCGGGSSRRCARHRHGSTCRRCRERPERSRVSSAGDLPVAARFARLAADAVPSGTCRHRSICGRPMPSRRPHRCGRPARLTIEAVSARGCRPAGRASRRSLRGRLERIRLRGPAAHAGCAGRDCARWWRSLLAFLLTAPGGGRGRDHHHRDTAAGAAARRGAAASCRSSSTRWHARACARCFSRSLLPTARHSASITRLGFTEAGRRKGYYQRRHGAEDAIVMRRELSP